LDRGASKKQSAEFKHWQMVASSMANKHRNRENHPRVHVTDHDNLSVICLGKTGGHEDGCTTIEVLR
jgi:hypothetical protein